MAKKPTQPGKGSKTIVKKQKNGDVVIVKKKSSEVGYKKPPKHTQFKKGKSGNPSGVNISPEKRALKELTSQTVAEAIKQTLTCTEAEITALLNDPTTTIGHKVILRAALDAAHNGEYGKFDHILERAIGKVSVNINMSSVNLNGQLEDKAKVKQVLKELENEV
jgi:hypothetical protein